MEHSLGVGTIIGLTVASSVYVWKNDKFSSTQKTLLLICIIFPPAQWLSIILVLLYNSYQANNSSERVQERKVVQIKTNLDNSISNLIDLKNKGLLTDEEYKTKVGKINAKKDEQSLKNSPEYKKLKSLFDSGILTKEELENKIQLLQNVSEKEVDVAEISKIVITSSQVYIEPTYKKNSSIFYYLLTILFFVFIILTGTELILLNQKEDNLENNYIPPVVNTTGYNEGNLNQKSLNYESDNYPKKEIEKVQSISLFSDVSGIYPDKTSFNEVKSILGEPDFIDITKMEFDENSGKFLGGNKIVKYKSLGINILFEREDTNMSAVDNVLVKENFNAKSAEGIYIGMPEDECRNILDSKYFKDFETDDYKSYAKKEGGLLGLSVWFKDGKLYELAIH